MGKKTEIFNRFVEDQTKVLVPPDVNNKYEYEDSATMRNRFLSLFSGSKERLRFAFDRFIKTNKGTCWELAMSYDYRLLKSGKKNHHIAAVKTSSITCHTFNIYVDDKDTLHIVDLFQHFKDTAIPSFAEFKAILSSSAMYDRDYTKWYVLSEVKNNFVENFKRLGMKKWATFCGKTERDGGFMVINENEGIFKINDSKSIKWRFTPFKFPTFG